MNFNYPLMPRLFLGLRTEDSYPIIDIIEQTPETPEGNLPCLITGRDQWIDRSQPPVCSFILWKIWKHTGAADLVELGRASLRTD